MNSKLMMIDKALMSLLKIYLKTPMTPFRKEKIKLTLIKLLTMHVIVSDKKKQKRSMWVRPIYSVQQRSLQGDSDNLILMLRTNDHSLHFNYLRMDVNIFDELLAIVGPVIEKQMVVREPIPAYTRLQICLRYLASGDSIKSVGYAFRTSPNTVAQIVHETCHAIWCQLKDVVLRVPNKEEWIKIANDFEKMWQFIHCIGAIDGKHIVLQVFIKFIIFLWTLFLLLEKCFLQYMRQFFHYEIVQYNLNLHFSLLPIVAQNIIITRKLIVSTS